MATGVTAPGRRWLPSLVRSGRQGGRRAQAGKPLPGTPGRPRPWPEGGGEALGSVTPERLRPRRDSRPGPAGTSGQGTRLAGSCGPPGGARPARPPRKRLTGSRSNAARRPTFCSLHFPMLTFSAKAEKNGLIARACHYRKKKKKKKLTGPQEMPQNVRSLSQSPHQA